MKCSRYAMLVLVPKIETRKKKKPDKPNNSNLWTQHTKFFEHAKHLPNECILHSLVLENAV